MPRLARSSKAAVVSAAVLFLIVAGVALAQTAASDKLRTGQSVTVAAGETVPNDLYAFGGTIRIDGTVDGDLVATGGTVDVTGSVTGDVLAAGGNVSIGGTVGGDVRIAGGMLTVAGAVTEDVVATGGTLTLASSGSVGEDLFASTGRLAIDGAVTGDVTASTGSYTKTGTIGGTEDVRINAGPSTPSGPPVAPTPASQAIGAFQHFLVVLLVGAVLIWVTPRTYAAMKAAVQKRPLPAAGWGIAAFLGFIALLILIVVAMILFAILFGALGFDDLVGLDILGGIVAMLGVILGFVVICAYVADAIVGAALAGLVIRDRATDRTRELGLLAAGAAVVVLVSSVPVLGPWVKLVVIVLGLGAVLIALMRSRQSPGPTEPVIAAAPPPATMPPTPTT
jgi:cytoskeletal protein CcmA (bactofilin family)